MQDVVSAGGAFHRETGDSPGGQVDARPPAFRSDGSARPRPRSRDGGVAWGKCRTWYRQAGRSTVKQGTRPEARSMPDLPPFVPTAPPGPGPGAGMAVLLGENAGRGIGRRGVPP